MTSNDIARLRLLNQLLLNQKAKTPAEVVARLGGVQAQDYTGGELSIGLRLPGSTITNVERSIKEREVIRTWGLRGTLHFLSVSDIDWILGLLAPMIISELKGRYEELELDTGTLRKTNSLLEKHLKGNRHLTRRELVAIIEKKGISCKGQRATFILHRASLDKVICFGVTRGRQQTHTLFEEWVNKRNPMSRDESLAELAHRYFTSHGPATKQDYMWWSGLKSSDANAGLEMIKSKLEQATVEGKTYWVPVNAIPAGTSGTTAYLLPSFDDFLIGYKDRSASISAIDSARLRGGGMPNQVIVIGGHVAGMWTRTPKKETVVVEINLFRKLKKPEKTVLDNAVERYIEFVGKNPIINFA